MDVSELGFSEAPLFSKAALEYYEREELVPLIGQALEELKESRSEDGVIRADLCVLLRTMLARISAVTTGIDGVDTPERTDAFRIYVEQLGVGATVEWSTEDHGEVIDRILAVRKDFERDFYDASVARRKALIAQFEAGEIERDDLPRDLLTLMYLHWNDEWDDELPLREAALYLVAATQTTTHATSWLPCWLPEPSSIHPTRRHTPR